MSAADGSSPAPECGPLHHVMLLRTVVVHVSPLASSCCSAFAALRKGATIDDASALHGAERKARNGTVWAGHHDSAQPVADDVLRDLKRGGKPLLRTRVLPARLLTHDVEQLHDIERCERQRQRNATITNEGALEQGVAKIAALIVDDNLVPGFDLVYTGDSNESAHEGGLLHVRLRA
jgi:hypothetical protein